MTSTKPPPKQENPLANLLLNVIAPSVILSYCSKESGPVALGPTKALILAVSIPLIYGVREFARARKVNLFSVIGLVSVGLTGGLGLLKTSAFWFACKEAAVPLILAAAIWVSHFQGKKCLTRALLLNPELFDMPRIEARVAENQAQDRFARSITTSMWFLVASFLLSTALNFGLWMYLLAGKAGGSPEYTAAIGRGTWMGFLVIGLPATAVMIFAWMRLLKQLELMTNFTKEELLLPR